MGKLIIVRHGESLWNKENRFTGWVDVDLSNKGIKEAKKAGKILKNYRFDTIYVSHMIRAIHTLNIILSENRDNRTPIIYHEDDIEMKKREKHKSKNSEIRIYQTKALAERFYGALQGLNKEETAKKYGKEKVHEWRRSYDIRPPKGESLKDTLNRVLPYWRKKISKDIMKGKTVLIVAHGNSLRAIVKYIEKIPDNKIPEYEIPTGTPIEYSLDNKLNVINKKVLDINKS